MEIGCHPGDDGNVFVGVYAANKIEVNAKSNATSKDKIETVSILMLVIYGCANDDMYLFSYFSTVGRDMTACILTEPKHKVSEIWFLQGRNNP